MKTKTVSTCIHVHCRGPIADEYVEKLLLIIFMITHIKVSHSPILPYCVSVLFFVVKIAKEISLQQLVGT